MKSQTLRELSPTTAELIQSLRRGPALLRRWNTEDRTVETIYRIGAADEPAAIRELIPFGMSRDRDIRMAALSTIHRLFSLLPTEELPALDEWMRRHWESEWHRLKPDALNGFEHQTDAERIFLGLIASHRSGFVRREAVRVLALDESESVLPFLLIRLADWVNEVRAAAEEAVLGRLEPRYAKVLVDCSALLDRLGAGSRMNPEVSLRAEKLLKTPECVSELRRGMEHASPGIRRHCFRVAVQAPELKVADVVARGIGDSDVIVRRLAFRAGAELLPQERSALRKQASLDSYAPIRRLAFDSLENEQGAPFGEFEPFLFDRSSPLRRECQAVAAKRFGLAVADFY